MAKWFRKKPIKVQALKYYKNADEVVSFCPEAVEKKDEDSVEFLIIKTPEGERRLDKGDWVLRGDKGHYYICEDHILEEYYEEVK